MFEPSSYLPLATGEKALGRLREMLKAKASIDPRADLPSGMIGVNRLREMIPVLERAVETILKKIVMCSYYHIDKMVSSREYTEALLSHTDPRLRWAALEVFGICWASTNEEFANMCENFLDDEFDDVRLLSIGVISSFYRGSFHQFYIRKFIELCSDESVSLSVRRLSYYGFLNLIGEPYSSRPRLTKLITEEPLDPVRLNCYLVGDLGHGHTMGSDQVSGFIESPREEKPETWSDPNLPMV